MEEEKTVKIRFNQILCEEMSKTFELKSLPLDPEFKVKYSEREDKSVYIKSEYLGCTKTAGIRFGEMDFGGSMIVNFGSVPPAKDYVFPILGFTFVYSNKFLIVVLDLHPISKDEEYMNKYITPLKDVSEKYKWIPKIEGGRSEVHEWAKIYDSGYSLYRWCDRKYLSNVEDAFRDYTNVFCDCIRKAEPLTDREALSKKDRYMEKYRYDYAYKDPGSSPLKMHFGEDWGGRYMNDFLFAP
jgi:15,16-dihydrobiliverdin:ferredoxin oxidoreductase